MLPLRDYQEQGLAAITEAEARGIRRQVFVLPTGEGKTVCFAHLLSRRGGRAVVIAHRDELVQQAARKIRGIYPEARLGIVKADDDEVGAQVVVASVQTLARPNRLQRLIDSTAAATLFREPEPFRTVVVDEMHHYVAGEEGNMFGRVLEGLGCMRDDGPLTVGFTATPEREDGAGLGGTWQEIVFARTILDGIKSGSLVDIKPKEIKLSADFNKLHVRAGDFKDEETAEMLMEADAPKHAAEAYLKWTPVQKAIAFTPTIAVAHAFAQAFRDRGVASEAVDGTMARTDRRAILERFSSGKTMVVPNAQVLTEGFDEPSVSVVIMGRPSRSRVNAIQCIGRALRPHPGKTHATVLDLVGSTVRKDLVTVATLFDIDPEAAEEFGVFAAKKKAATVKASADDTRDGRLIAIDVELFKGREFSWVPTRSGRFALSLGAEGTLALEAAGQDVWDVVKIKRVKVGVNRGGWPKFEEQRQKLYAGLSLGYAQGAGEDYVRKNGAHVLNAKDARWRQAPATDGQRGVLGPKGKWRDGMLRGEASDLITALTAR